MKLPFKRLLAALLAALTLLALAGCGSSGKTDAAPKDYTQILHDARPDEDNEYYMIFSPARRASSPPSTATAKATKTPTNWMKRSGTCCFPC